MSYAKRWTALFCALALLLPIAGCSETPEEPTETPDAAVSAGETEAETDAPEETEESFFQPIQDDLPEGLDLGGRAVTFLSRGMAKTIHELHVDEVNGEVVNDAIFEREVAVEERLNCAVENLATGTDGHGGDLNTMVAASVRAGDDAYDVLANSNYSTTNTFGTGNFLNLYNVENLNLEKEYWAQHLIDSTSVGGVLFGVTGSISLFLYQEMFAVFFNRNLCEEFGISADDVYQTVFDGKWTLDQMIGMTKDIYVDVNGNGETDENDVYGYGLQVSSSTDGYWTSCQIRMTGRDENGGVYLDTDVEKLTSVVERLQDFAYNQKGCIRLIEGSGYTDGVYLPEAFAKDQLLFMNDWIYSTETGIFREMTSDYGIIPYPKYDEAQDDYYSYLHDAFTTFCILTTVDNPGEVGAVMEAMASDSHNRVIPAYYETALTTKYARDEASVTSLQTIFKNAYLDTGWVYSLNLNSYPQNTLRELVWRGTGTPTTKIAQLEKSVNKILGKLSERFAEAAGNP